jgi:predicted DNA-binding protein
MDNKLNKRKKFKKNFIPKGRNRVNILNIRLNDNEELQLNEDIKKTNKNKSDYVRDLIKHAKINEKPDERFYEISKILIRIGGNLNQLAIKANALNFIDVDAYKKEVDDLNKYKAEIRNKYL